MSTNFPTSIDDGTTLPNPLATSSTVGHASLHDNENGAIIALETKLGTGSSTASSSKVLRGTGSGISAWAALNLTSDTTGTLPVASGGTGVTSSTGTGSVVLSSSPSLSAPSFTTISNTGVITLPTATDTLVGRSTTDILSNKSINGASNTLTNISPASINELGTWNQVLDPIFPNTIVQGTWAIGAESAQYKAFAYINVGAQNDEVDYKIFLQAGTYTFNILTDTALNRGIVTVLVDTVSKGTLDCYTGSTVQNVVKTITGIVISTSGIHTVGYKLATKNASSSNYILALSALSFIRTA